MNLPRLTIVILITLSLAPFIRAEEEKSREEIKFPSPDGKFALRLFTDRANGRAETRIVRLPDHAVVVDLDDWGAPYIWEKTLVWSPDSQRVAYFSPDRRGATTTVYFRKGDSLEKIDLLELPSPKFAKKTPEACEIVGQVEQPVRWLKSGSLLIYSEIEDECDNEAAAEITIAFDKSNKPSVLKMAKTAVRKK
jgi:hypothetical protein